MLDGNATSDESIATQVAQGVMSLNNTLPYNGNSVQAALLGVFSQQVALVNGSLPHNITIPTTRELLVYFLILSLLMSYLWFLDPTNVFISLLIAITHRHICVSTSNVCEKISVC